MIEIVFSDSACGGLKLAQHYGEGEFINGYSGVVFSKIDGSEPMQEELDKAQREVEEQDRREWDNATPMGGDPNDVFGFHLMLSIGDIAKENFVSRRKKTIAELWSIYPGDPSELLSNMAADLQEALKTIRERAVRGEDIRIWYSNQPDDLCGLYWFLEELQPLEEKLGNVLLVKLPEHEYCDNNTVISYHTWGEISPGEWYRYTALAETTTTVFRQHYAAQWRNLQKENAPLRAVLNGQLLSVPETIYDSFICREIDAQGDEFQEAMVVGNVLGKYRLGIVDAWIAHRIEKMIDHGELAITSAVVKGMPMYHCRLKKNHSL